MSHVVSLLSMACWCAVTLSRGARASESPASSGRGNAVPQFNATLMFTDYQEVLDPAEPLQLGVTAYQQGKEGAPGPGAPWFRKASHGRHELSLLLARGDLIPLVSVQRDTFEMMCSYWISCLPDSTQKTGLRVWSPLLVPWMPPKTHQLRLLVENISLQQATPVLPKAGAFPLPLGCCAHCRVSSGRHWLAKLLYLRLAVALQPQMRWCFAFPILTNRSQPLRLRLPWGWLYCATMVTCKGDCSVLGFQSLWSFVPHSSDTLPSWLFLGFM